MPRISLPNEMKKFRSFEVTITQTKEEDIWEFIRSTMFEFEEKADLINDAKTKFINEQYDTNPYLDADFKQEVNKVNEYEWIRDEFKNIIRKYSTLEKDLELCKCMWKDNEERLDLINDWIFAIEKFITNINDNIEFKVANNINYNNAYKIWRQKHSKYIEQRSEAVSHQFCDYPDCYPEPHVEGEHYYLKGETKHYFNKNCGICLRQKQAYYDEIEYSKRMVIENAERDTRYKAEREKKLKEDELKEEERKKTLPTYECKECSYTTKYYSEYQAHLESKEHTNAINLKKWYCEHCKTQPRNLTEYMFHNSTKKHKIAIGELEADPTEYNCEKCNYRTDIKQNWEKHLKSKKHFDEKV